MPLRPRRRQTRRKRAILALGVVAVVVGSGAVVAMAGAPAASPWSTSTPVIANSLALLDTASDRIVADVPVGSNPGPLAVDDRSVWVGNLGDRTLSQVDRTSHKLVKTYGLSNAPITVAAGAGNVLVGDGFDGTLTRIVPELSQQTGPFFPSGKQSGRLSTAASTDALWVGLPDRELDRLDPASLEVTTRFPLAARAQAIIPDHSKIWYVGDSDATLHEVDPANLLAPRTVALPGGAVAIGSGAGSIWVATVAPDDLVEIDPVSAEIKQTIALPAHPTSLAVGNGAAWIVTKSGALTRIDLTSKEIRTDDLGHPIASIALVGTELWLTLR